MNTPVMTDYLIIPYALLTKPKVKITGCWASSFFVLFLTTTTLRSIKKWKKRTRVISSHAWSKRIYHTSKRFRFIKNQERIVYFEPGKKAVFVAQ